MSSGVGLIGSSCAIGTTVVIPAGGALPVASASYQGRLYVLLGGGGVADTVYICLKRAAGTYSWVKIIDGDSGILVKTETGI